MQSRFEAQHETSLAPLVGREEELELLLRRWNQASHGEGRVVLLTGEPGVGKSRLIAALQERLQSQPHVRIRYFCSPQHSDSALYPIINQLERAARFDPWLTSTVRKYCYAPWHRPPFRNAQIHAVIMFFVSNGRRSPEPRRRQCDDAISNKGLSIVIRS